MKMIAAMMGVDRAIMLMLSAKLSSEVELNPVSGALLLSSVEPALVGESALGVPRMAQSER